MVPRPEARTPCTVIRKHGDTLLNGGQIELLGGTLEPSPSDPRQINLTRAADRIAAVLDLLRLHKGNALVLGGGADQFM